MKPGVSSPSLSLRSECSKKNCTKKKEMERRPSDVEGQFLWKKLVRRAGQEQRAGGGGGGGPTQILVPCPSLRL